MRRLALLALALPLAACTRDLAIPPRNTLAFADPNPSAAPREALVLAVSGGVRPYAFRFAGNAASSGPDASLAPSPAGDGADYQAGSRGPALDVIEVQDARGSVQRAQVSVGSPLSVAPTAAFLAPSGRVSFVASGGKAPYLLEKVDPTAPGVVSGTDYVAAPSGGCTGTVSEPGAVTLRLRDATAVAPVTLQVSVGRGLDLFPAAGTGAVAPYEHIAFVASGGQPPYEFSMVAPVPSGGPGVDPGRGTYQAGAVGDVVDRVQVTDANGEQRCFDVSVGPPLAVELSTTDIRPGRPLHLLASGGRPPYRYAYAFKGNRSRGAIDAVTGEYVPGVNANTTDLVLVADATSAPPVGPLSLAVGPLAVESGAAATGCGSGDIDRDGLADFIFADSLGGMRAMVSAPLGSFPRVDGYAVDAFPGEPVLVDLDGDGRSDVVYADSATGDLVALLGQADGRLAVGPRAAVSATLAFARIGIAPGSGRIFFGSSSATACGGGLGLEAVDYAAASRSFGAPICVAGARNATVVAAGDWDGDGIPDVAYAIAGTTDRILFRLGGGGTPYATEAAVLLPAPWRIERASSTVVHQVVPVKPAGAAFTSLLAYVNDAPRTGDFRTGLAVLAGGPGGLALQQVDLLQFAGGFNILGMAAVGMGAGQLPRIALWNGTDGQSLLYDWPFTTSPPTPSAFQLAPRPFRVGCIAGADADGDGIADLAVAPRDQGPSAELLLGDSDGSFARRPRYFAETQGVQAGDLDGDGIPDFIGIAPGEGFEILFGGVGTISLGPQVPIAGEFLMAKAADFDGDGIPDVMARIGATGFFLYQGLASRDGRVGAPLPVEVRDWTGAPFDVTTVIFDTARFGGTSPGPDISCLIRVGSLVYPAAVVFSDPTNATIGLPPLTSSFQAQVVADLDGDGIDDLVFLSATDTRVALVKPADPPSSSWPFRPWTVVSPVQGFYPAAGSVNVPGALPPRRRAVIVTDTGVLYVEAPGGAPVATLVPYGGGLTLPGLSAAAIGDVDGDGLPDLVVSQFAPDPWHVFRGLAGGTFETSPAAGLDFAGGDAGFSLTPGATAGLDLILAYNTAMVIHPNDGAGHFR